MIKEIRQALDCTKRHGAQFADIRYKNITSENLLMENGKISNISSSQSQGYGIRVYINGSMGFAASNDMDALIETAKKACDIARQSQALQENHIKLDSKRPAVAHYDSPIDIDPFNVPLDEKIKLLTDCHENMIKNANRTHLALDFRKDNCIFADTDGSLIKQNFCQVSANIIAMAISDDDTQTRKYINVIRGGYEDIINMDLPNRALKLGEEVAILINAPDCPSGEFDVILTPRQMFLQIHESVGHPTELDRVLGSEASFAGRSFIEPKNLKKLKYGSKHVTITADATTPKGLGTFMYDDEGVKAQNITLIDKGKFTAFQTAREYAPEIGQDSSGAGLSDGWKNLPIVRMTNINMLPGNQTLDELIAGIEYGFLFDENKSWSIDDLRINFQFACEIAYEIKGGKLTGNIFKNPIYAGKTKEFWNSCDGAANEKHWELVGVPNCGKGQPMQVMRVSHGSSPTRFRKIKVGVSDVK